MILSSWEIACIEYALADYKPLPNRKDLKAGTKSAYSKIVEFVKSAEEKLPYGDKMNYSANLKVLSKDEKEAEEFTKEAVELLSQIEISRINGKKTSAKKAKSSAENGKKGGRPRKSVK